MRKPKRRTAIILCGCIGVGALVLVCCATGQQFILAPIGLVLFLLAVRKIAKETKSTAGPSRETYPSGRIGPALPEQIPLQSVMIAFSRQQEPPWEEKRVELFVPVSGRVKKYRLTWDVQCVGMMRHVTNHYSGSLMVDRGVISCRTAQEFSQWLCEWDQLNAEIRLLLIAQREEVAAKLQQTPLPFRKEGDT